ncbi:hypothetical protein ACX80U_07430 [Arthrobacter sp. TmT3-37]
MTVPADVLLEGPRGRRLCLELALLLAPDLRSPVMRLAGALDPASGTSRVTLVLAASDDDGLAMHPGRPDAATPAGVAARIASINPGDISDSRILDAFGQSVGAARGWQEPDGEDVLAALPVIRESLLPVAGRVLASTTGPWLASARRTVQWHLDWHVPEDPVHLPGSPREALAAWARSARAEEERARHDRPSDPRAPYSGTWWSLPEGLLQTVGNIPAALDLVEDAAGEEFATAVPVRGGGRTFEVAVEEDWAALCREYPLDVTASRRHDWYRTTGRAGGWVIPDWERVAADWDAVHLSALGYLRCATRALRVEADTASVIAGWNPDTTVWLTDVARESVEPRQAWQRHQDTMAWAPARQTG